MTEPTRTGVALAAVVFGLALTSCGSGPAVTDTAGLATVTSTPVPANYTIVDYIRDNGIVETPVRRGDPGTPKLNLPTPPGWADAGPRTPRRAWTAMVLTDPKDAHDPPMITAQMSRLIGNVSPARVLEHAPGQIRKLPGYSGENDGTPTKFDGFDANRIGGNYVRNGVSRVVSQQTVVIPGQDGLYMLQLNADALAAQQQQLTAASAVIDSQTTIAP